MGIPPLDVRHLFSTALLFVRFNINTRENMHVVFITLSTFFKITVTIIIKFLAHGILNMQYLVAQLHYTYAQVGYQASGDVGTH